mmetsp:Transcript_24189/g.43300  ORF Transcript_24189/g.43300 Transcript_24189/m.43300 type:complete len:1063 (-) Transcript_24189:267-3455(-)|eukprot:CAMPEP_0175039734 /NCGR_PEP_ID=MMETSP0052_2-20121109/800_1 /TAXON_ID=51329 ORGANISM="Polytomella parva, Strain SAG 63-3" /NCGR_SAMPLE_ID=MMETSP0052_2 /ASSEMBLY_ACC=CAM_ASM_000194 /LENGTH=1062 /DNA_ID=CAMNT_0016301723 /DNA_START=180 /DNA_END=3368 /DNA_ORIENTATION=-
MGEVKVEVKETKDEVDFAKISLDEAFNVLGCTHHGLTSAEVQKRLEEYGPNKLPESTRIPILVFLGYMWNPLSWAMEAAAIVAICLLDYGDFALIVSLLLLNSVISYVEESNADQAIKALAAALAPKAKVLRDGKFDTIDAVGLVPGDVLVIKFGDIVPADIKLLSDGEPGMGDELPMQVDQAALTGESLPAKKFTGDVCFSGSAIKQGERHAVVYATGVNTFFGRAAALINATHNVANLQKIMTRIGAMCLVTIGIWLVIELCVQFGHYRHACRKGEDGCPTLTNCLVILVGGIPIAMPTVLSVTLALGAAALAKEGAIVARMSAVEEMAGMDVLCSDKTGTLTLNKLSIDVSSVYPTSGLTVLECMKYAALSTNIVTEEPIDMVLYNSYPEKHELANYKTVRFIPFNPTDKFTCATVVETATGKTVRIMKGSPQVILNKSVNKDKIADAVNNKMLEFANRGLRSLGISLAQGDGRDGDSNFTMLACVPMFDPPRHDTKSTIDNCGHQGIRVKMVTGDHLLIGKETARQLGMGQVMFPSEVLIKARNGDAAALQGHKNVTEMVEMANGFAEVFPEHKFEIVEILQNAGHTVGMTGDGVNDAPALKKADVGIAVAGATDAARGAADIVLTAPGLSAIVTAIIGARKIFQRMTTYAKYTVAMTFRICFTFGLITVIYNWYFPTLLIVILAVFNDGAMIALSKDRVIPSPTPNRWNLRNIFIMGIVYGLYLTLSSWAMYHTATKTNFFQKHFHLQSLDDRYHTLRDHCYSYIAETYTDRFGPDAWNTNLCDFYEYRAQYGFEDAASCHNSKSRLAWAYNNLLRQCIVEQYYVRAGMTRSFLYNQVSISGQALVFVVRHPGLSIIQRAGSLTYFAFFCSQIASTAIALFGFGGYEWPREGEGFRDCQFCKWSNGHKTFFFLHHVPMSSTESVHTSSNFGCMGYVIGAWIWSAIWYVLLDPIKWIISYILNDDGFRDASVLNTPTRSDVKSEKEIGVSGLQAPTSSNPLGRTSLVVPPAAVLDRKSAAIIPVSRNSAGMARVSADPSKTADIARRSRLPGTEIHKK